jgi:hypothetical protein
VIDWTRKRDLCPQCGRDHEKPANGTFGITPKADGNAIGHCFRCGYVTWANSEREFTPGPAASAAPSAPKHEKLSEFGQELWESCRPLSETALMYLQARQCVIPPADTDVRWHPALKHPPSGTVAPALVALVTDAKTREPLTLHRTWINGDGTKAPLKPDRMLLGNHRKAGGAIRLAPDECVTYALGIAEGIETALSLAHAGMPTWACIDAGNLKVFPVLPGIETLTIAADNDPAGLLAASRCAERWHAAGRTVFVVKAEQHGADLNDLARAAA